MDFSLSFLDYIRILLSIGAVFTIPGWAILSITDYWKSWHTLQRWIIAVGLSIAFYPILFYWARILTPSIQIGPNKNLAILIMGFVFTAWKLKKNWKTQFQFDRLELFAILIFLGTLFTRYYIAYTHPFPAWSDSLHHTLITKLVGLNGKLPYTLDPYAPTPLDMYHLGLYSLTGTVMQLANVPAHTSLLWTSQTLNGLCGLGIYLVLDRKVSRIGAITGATVVGLISHMPAFYVNWGRFTQIASQTILLIAIVVNWDAISTFLDREYKPRSTSWRIFTAGFLNAAIFFLHFRVAIFYVPLLVIVIGNLIIHKSRFKHKGVIPKIIGFLILSFLIISPIIINVLRIYYHITSTYTTNEKYLVNHGVSIIDIPYLVSQPILIYIALFGILISVIKRLEIGFIFIFWCCILIGFGNLYLLDIPLLIFTNLSGILIMFYIFVGIFSGIILDLFQKWFLNSCQNVKIPFVTIFIFLIGTISGFKQVNKMEEYRFFITKADLQAMTWIMYNTSELSTFAITTELWLKDFPHGIDAGYWIPYFTGRSTTASTMLTSLGQDNFYFISLQMSRYSAKLFENYRSIEELRNLDVDYIYIGYTQNERFLSSNLFSQLRHLVSNQEIKIVYDLDQVMIIEIL